MYHEICVWFEMWKVSKYFNLTSIYSQVRSISDFKLVDTSFKKMLSILGNNKYIEIILDKQLITW